MQTAWWYSNSYLKLLTPVTLTNAFETPVVETWPMWLWLLKIPTQYLLMLFKCCWCWCWETCWRHFVRDFEAEVWWRFWTRIFVKMLWYVVKVLIRARGHFAPRTFWGQNPETSFGPNCNLSLMNLFRISGYEYSFSQNVWRIKRVR